MSSISVAPMLRLQRDLYDLPLGPERFGRYLAVMTGGTSEMLLPLPAFNPMGKPHVADTLDALLALDAERVAETAVSEANGRLRGCQADFQVGLVVVDDLGGGWTNREAVELDNRYSPMALLKRGWATPLFWTTETPSVEGVRREVLETVYRNAFIRRHGSPSTLRDLLTQEGRAGAFAGAVTPALDVDELAYTREVIAPFLGSTDRAAVSTCLFGDEAARRLGHPPLGLADRAGLAAALAEAYAAEVALLDALA